MTPTLTAPRGADWREKKEDGHARKNAEGVARGRRGRERTKGGLGWVRPLLEWMRCKVREERTFAEIGPPLLVMGIWPRLAVDRRW